MPWLFRLPWFRRFTGYTMWPLILLARPLADVSDDLIVHELCHVWQMQHHPLAMPLSYLWQGYRDNPNEIEARAAAEQTPLDRVLELLHARRLRVQLRGDVGRERLVGELVLGRG